MNCLLCRYDTATPSVDPVHVSSVVVPGGYDLSTLNTTQVSSPMGRDIIFCLLLPLQERLLLNQQDQLYATVQGKENRG